MCSSLIPSIVAVDRGSEGRNPVSSHMEWQDTQGDIAVCQECIGRWKGLVIQPQQVGEIPDPPPIVKVLFVGMAPTNREGKNKGNHFYSAARDALRNGLFRLLGIPLDGLRLEEAISVFHRRGYFFVHAGKIRPVGQDAPPRDALMYCANRHLRVEINILNPVAICFLGVTNLALVTTALFDRQIDEIPVRVSLDRWTGWVALAFQPVRGGEKRTALVLEKLLSLVNGQDSIDKTI